MRFCTITGLQRFKQEEKRGRGYKPLLLLWLYGDTRAFVQFCWRHILLCEVVENHNNERGREGEEREREGSGREREGGKRKEKEEGKERMWEGERKRVR